MMNHKAVSFARAEVVALRRVITRHIDAAQSRDNRRDARVDSGQRADKLAVLGKPIVTARLLPGPHEVPSEGGVHRIKQGRQHAGSHVRFRVAVSIAVCFADIPKSGLGRGLDGQLPVPVGGPFRILMVRMPCLEKFMKFRTSG